MKLADLIIGIENKYDYIEKMCSDYITNRNDCDFIVSVTDEEIKKESEEKFSLGYLESLAIYRKISEKIIEYNGFLMHGVVVDACSKGIIFCAKSGVGKSTHAMLWKKYLGDKCEIINGDKPLIRIIDGVVYAFGTPWCGKEGINKNTKVSLSSVCFLVRSEKNEISEIPKTEAFFKAMLQIHIPPDKKSEVLDLVDKFINIVSFYLTKCNMEIDAAKVACERLLK